MLQSRIAQLIALCFLSILTRPASALGVVLSGCGETTNCWAHPPGCLRDRENATSTPDAVDCLSSVEWNMTQDGIRIRLQAVVTDLDQTRPFYAAVGFSYNQKMEDDTVIDCVVNSEGQTRTSVSFNDGTKNTVLPQASLVLLENSSSSLVDGILTCETTFLIDNVNKVDEIDLFKIHDVEAQPYYLIFARGNAIPYTFTKDIHNVNDGAQFPWTTGTQVSFCRHNCSGPEFVVVDDALQNFVTRYWRYRIAVLHGIGLMFSWWVLGSNGILIARFLKPLFARQKFLGAAVWFQMHRTMMFLAVVIQVVAVLFIFYQANWIWYECTYACDSDAFAKKMHAICGVFATCLAVVQPFIALVRPAPDSPSRPLFNWAHWLIGMTAWSFASATILMAIPLGKTGLLAVFGHVPNYVFGGYIIVFAITNVILEMLSSTSERRTEKNDPFVHRFVVGPSGMALSTLNGPTTEAALAHPTYGSLRLLIIFIHFLVSLGVVICLTVMLVSHLLNHSPS